MDWKESSMDLALHAPFEGTKGFIQLFSHMQTYSPRPINGLQCVKSVEFSFMLLLIQRQSAEYPCSSQVTAWFTRIHLHNCKLAELYLEDGLHIWPYETRGVGDQVTKHTSTLLFVPADTTVLQLCQDLQQIKKKKKV